MTSFAHIAAIVVDAVHLAIILSASMISYFYVCYRARGYYKKHLLYTSTIAALSFAANVAIGRCPLTIASEWIRQQADPAFSMSNGFIAYYLNDILGLHLPVAGLLALIYCAMVVPSVITFLTFGYDGFTRKGERNL